MTEHRHLFGSELPDENEGTWLSLAGPQGFIGVVILPAPPVGVVEMEAICRELAPMEYPDEEIFMVRYPVDDLAKVDQSDMRRLLKVEDLARMGENTKSLEEAGVSVDDFGIVRSSE